MDARIQISRFFHNYCKKDMRQYRAIMNMQDDSGATPLFFAQNSDDFIKLVGFGADIYKGYSYNLQSKKFESKHLRHNKKDTTEYKDITKYFEEQWQEIVNNINVEEKILKERYPLLYKALEEQKLLPSDDFDNIQKIQRYKNLSQASKHPVAILSEKNGYGNVSNMLRSREIGKSSIY